MPKTSIEISTGTTLEEVRARKKIIRDFYATWNAANPTKQVYTFNIASLRQNKKRLLNNPHRVQAIVIKQSFFNATKVQFIFVSTKLLLKK